MQSTLKITMAAGLAVALAFASPVLAQPSMSIGTIINGIGGVDYMEAVAKVHSAPAVRVIRLSSLAGADKSADRLAATLARESREVRLLRSGLSFNPVALTALRNNNVDLFDVVSLYMSGDGATVLYVNDL